MKKYFKPRLIEAFIAFTLVVAIAYQTMSNHKEKKNAECKALLAGNENYYFDTSENKCCIRTNSEPKCFRGAGF